MEISIGEFWKRRQLSALLILVALTLGLGFLGGLLGGSAGYELLEAPPLAPPAVVFPIVWTVLYVLMGISAYLVWSSGDTGRGQALVWYLLQLLINSLWPLLFFRLHLRLPAFFWILLLIAVFSLTLSRFRAISETAYFFLLPTLPWLLFAAYLNLGFYLLNR